MSASTPCARVGCMRASVRTVGLSCEASFGFDVHLMGLFHASVRGFHSSVLAAMSAKVETGNASHRKCPAACEMFPQAAGRLRSRTGNARNLSNGHPPMHRRPPFLWASIPGYSPTKEYSVSRSDRIHTTHSTVRLITVQGLRRLPRRGGGETCSSPWEALRM